MPELPEAEVIACQLRDRVLGAVLKDCWVARPDIVRQGLSTLDWYRGARLIEIERKGKSIALAFARAGETRYLVAELGMTGLLFFRSPAEQYQKHTHLILSLSGSREAEVRYWNPRRFGRVYLLNGAGLASFTEKRFGPDPLRMRRDDFVRLVKGCRGRVKALLLNQRKLAGIGNIYANEILYRARVHPHARGAGLPGSTVGRLYKAMQAVLQDAVACGGSTIRDFLAPDGTRGRFQERHLVYGKAGQTCPAGCGGTIRRLRAERSSFYCRICQKR